MSVDLEQLFEFNTDKEKLARKIQWFADIFLNCQDVFDNKFINRLKQGREIEDKTVNANEIICTTYFTSNIDPQRQTVTESDNINYIKPWYDSVSKQNLNGVVFYDYLSSMFVNQYQTQNITFVKCKLGGYSLNDERFIIYLLFFLKNKCKTLLLTDGNDVIINKNPFDFIKKKNKNILFVGRGELDFIYQSQWNINSAQKLKDSLGISLPKDYYEMIIYNAGIIGGEYNVLLYFLFLMCNVILQANSDKNNNMAILHYCLYNYFIFNQKTDSMYYRIRRYVYIRTRRICKKYNLEIQDYMAVTPNVFSGYPLNSYFKNYQTKTNSFLIHK